MYLLEKYAEIGIEGAFRENLDLRRLFKLEGHSGGTIGRCGTRRKNRKFPIFIALFYRKD